MLEVCTCCPCCTCTHVQERMQPQAQAEIEALQRRHTEYKRFSALRLCQLSQYLRDFGSHKRLERMPSSMGAKIRVRMPQCAIIQPKAQRCSELLRLVAIIVVYHTAIILAAVVLTSIPLTSIILSPRILAAITRLSSYLHLSYLFITRLSCIRLSHVRMSVAIMIQSLEMRSRHAHTAFFHDTLLLRHRQGTGCALSWIPLAPGLRLMPLCDLCWCCCL